MTDETQTPVPVEDTLPENPTVSAAIPTTTMAAAMLAGGVNPAAISETSNSEPVPTETPKAYAHSFLTRLEEILKTLEVDAEDEIAAIREKL